jgi:flagellar biosynthesis protein
MKKPDAKRPRLAVALEYDGKGAPRVTAKGVGEVADQILELARAHDVPLQSDRELVNLLAQVPLHEEIPEALYRLVAEVIAFAYMVKGRVPMPPAAEPTSET